jgi:hypothetical protein
MKYSTKLMVALFGISFLLFGGVQAFGQEWSAEQTEVLQMEVAYWGLLKGGNLKGYMELWHNDVIAWPHWALKPVSKDGLEKGTIPWYQRVRSYDLTPQAINIFGNFAVIYYRYNVTISENTLSGRIGHFWMKQDGKWQIIGGYSGGGTTAEAVAADDSAKIVGIWKLVSYEVEPQATGQREPVLGKAPTGALIFTPEKRMTVVNTGEGRKAPNTDQDRADLFKSMVAYTGNYRVEGDKWITKVDVAANPAWVGTEQTRFFRVDGNRLQESTAVMPWAARPEKGMVRFILTYERQ